MVEEHYRARWVFRRAVAWKFWAPKYWAVELDPPLRLGPRDTVSFLASAPPPDGPAEFDLVIRRGE